jgi:HD-like signal output (HDOD) protein/CheY-like chemotaxis protein
MMRLLFVDDEKLVLDGLRRGLSGLRGQWQMEFCDSPIRACDLLGTTEFDVVVSDMRMPAMDGAQFLERVASARPNALRVILSGQSEMEATVRAATIAHQFLAKPCEGQVLTELLGRTIQLHGVLHDSDLRAVVSLIRGLPSPPKVYHVLSGMMADPEVDMGQVCQVVSGDMGLTAKLLQLVNSSFFGMARRVTSVRDAVAILGMQRLKNVVLCSEVYSTFDAAKLPEGFDPEIEIAHSQLTARIARGLLQDKAQAEFAFLAGMLHDIGAWIAATCMPEDFVRGFQDARSRGITRDHAEPIRAHLPHTRLGAYLLGIWNLPYPVVEAVAAHHSPSEVGATRFDALGAVHVADCLAWAVGAVDATEAEHHMARLDQEYLNASGIGERVAGWLAQAREVAREAA